MKDFGGNFLHALVHEVVCEIILQSMCSAQRVCVSGIFLEARMAVAVRQCVHEQCQVEFSAQEAQLEPRAENSTNSVLCTCALGLVNFFSAGGCCL